MQSRLFCQSFQNHYQLHSFIHGEKKNNLLYFLLSYVRESHIYLCKKKVESGRTLFANYSPHKVSVLFFFLVVVVVDYVNTFVMPLLLLGRLLI